MVFADRKLKFREIVNTLKISEGSVFIILYEHLNIWTIFSQSIKNNNASTTQNDVWSCFSAIKWIFSYTMWQWMKHGSIITLQSQIRSQLSEQQRVKTAQSDQKRKYQLVRFWPPYFGMHTVFYSSITLRKKEPSLGNIIWYYWCIWRKKLRKTDPK